MDEVFLNIAQKAQANFRKSDGDYEKGGLVICGRCNSPRQKQIALGGRHFLVACMCSCESDAWDLEQEEIRKQRRMEAIERMRTTGIRLGLQGCTFDVDNGKNPKQLEMARRYVAEWDKMRSENIGLLFWGNTGNGKTFTAACVANELVNQGIPTLVTSFPKILENAQGMYPEDRMDYFRSFNVYDLLVIDDLGVERQTDYAMEVVYNVIDQRYVIGKPIIITTNLTLGEVKNPPNMRLQRIYDRITEMCIPVKFSGESMREEAGKKKIDEARRILYGGV